MVGDISWTPKNEDKRDLAFKWRPTLLELWGLEHTSHLTTVVIMKWPHLQVSSPIYDSYKLDSMHVNLIMSQWTLVSNEKCVLEPHFLVVQVTIKKLTLNIKLGGEQLNIIQVHGCVSFYI